ncbi:amino acid adenylation domain-containing protein [Streptomyces sp. yr375]|uniref:AMP-binding protein n=1 Tax=Streptomyces sp. yr375 TaxID=1761906 RepID=UPI0008D6B5F1|nr:AMP-binding protein [Streptomyces sp. yr375]SER13331.1 amino acid adenylation domain-containing protein [Streptomyces sp. yr375]
MTVHGTAARRRTLHDWFAVTAAAHGDRPALEIGAVHLTYDELSGLADRLAARLLATLRPAGAPGTRRASRAGRSERVTRVGLAAERTAVAYVAYLAVQRLGATVVPLGPSFPPGRNAAIARAAGLDAIVSDGTCDHLDRLPAPAPALTLTDTDLPALAAAPRPALPAPQAGPDDLAYILFTSGSTGVPKGVPVRHRNVCAYLAHAVPRHEAGPGARVSQTFALTFDPSVLDMYAAWGTGATLVAATSGDLLTPVRFVNRRGLTHWNSVPSVISIAHRLRALKPGSMPGLRRSMFCGEPLTLRQASAWHAAAPSSAIENAYGPTELTVTCTSYRLPAAPEDWPAPPNGTVPIGPLHPGLEARMREGELCVRGPQRFPGYLDPADDTGRFLAPDGSPYDPAAGALTDAHWYRTGDRVAPLREDGADGAAVPGVPLVHLGRVDQQVQVHGYRVELGEVEAALRALPGVVDAAVLALPAADGSVELAAAVTGTGASARSLHEALRGRLPAYMVPAHLTRLDSLPVNRNGKTDRTALGRVIR